MLSKIDIASPTVAAAATPSSDGKMNFLKLIIVSIK
jgi:hypothetical protein